MTQYSQESLQAKVEITQLKGIIDTAHSNDVKNQITEAEYQAFKQDLFGN